MGLSPAGELLPFSFSQLGVAEVLGKHLVLRSASDARELEAIERALPDLDVEARRELYSKRKLHKATASLLHELGHALGAIHTTRRDELMHPIYGIEMKGFSEPTRALLRVSLESRQATGESGSSGTLAARMLNLLKGTPSGTWNADELDERVKALERMAAVGPNAGSGAGQTQQSKSAPVPGLAPSDEAAYREATGLLDAKQPKEAWVRAKPLFDRYAESYEVQDLRCKISMQLSLAWEIARKECEALMRLTGASTAPETAR